jgi:hypothetical protein
MYLCAQSIQDLDRDPSFKGITIGAPITKYSDILTYSNTNGDKNIYNVKEDSYLSIFNVKMQEMKVVEKDGKVYAIHLSKTIPADRYGLNPFNADELLSWYSNLRSKYGNNCFSLDNNSKTPMICGMRWKANTAILDIVYLYYGVANAEKSKLQYLLYQREDDY